MIKKIFCAILFGFCSSSIAMPTISAMSNCALGEECFFKGDGPQMLAVYSLDFPNPGTDFFCTVKIGKGYLYGNLDSKAGENFYFMNKIIRLTGGESMDVHIKGRYFDNPPQGGDIELSAKLDQVDHYEGSIMCRKES